jgi:hypothetical protein
MPMFKVFRSYGYVGTRSEKEVECDDQEQAEEYAGEWALDKVESWAEPIESKEPKA